MLSNTPNRKIAVADRSEDIILHSRLCLNLCIADRLPMMTSRDTYFIIEHESKINITTTTDGNTLDKYICNKTRDKNINNIHAL